jgi:hypothetical protein
MDKRAGLYYKESGDMDYHINHRDHKEGGKPPGWFKRIRRRMRRHREKMAMRNGKVIPQFKNDDQWNWT